MARDAFPTEEQFMNEHEKRRRASAARGRRMRKDAVHRRAAEELDERAIPLLPKGFKP